MVFPPLLWVESVWKDVLRNRSREALKKRGGEWKIIEIKERMQFFDLFPKSAGLVLTVYPDPHILHVYSFAVPDFNRKRRLDRSFSPSVPKTLDRRIDPGRKSIER